MTIASLRVMSGCWWECRVRRQELSREEQPTVIWSVAFGRNHCTNLLESKLLLSTPRANVSHFQDRSR